MKISSENNSSVREKIYTDLKKMLLTGLFSPNKRLTEASLVKTFGVSRTPVREALHKLELEGLVKTAGARGFCVPDDSAEEMNELFEIRTVLEAHALACVCEIITEDQIRSLTELVLAAEQAFLSDKLDQIFDYNTQFHDMLYGIISSSKPRLFSIIEDMRAYVLRYRKNALIHHNGAQRSITGHKKILMALDLKDPHLCECIMRKHIFESKEDALLNKRLEISKGDHSIKLRKKKLENK